jgi:FkbM family methyltransferase
MKEFLRDATERQGYKIAKYPTVAFTPISVFDLAVILLMRAQGPQRTFVQIGANDGSYGDAISKYAVKYCWRGILVEPQADVFGRLQATYAAAADRLLFENVAIGQGQSEIKMYRAKKSANVDPIHASTVVSTSAHTVASQLRIAESQLEAFIVRCLTLDGLLEKHGWTTMDILLLDTEGFDQKVLATLDLARTTPLIVQFEHGHLAPREINLAVEYLAAHGYQVLYGGHQIDTVALHKSYWSKVEVAQPT